MTYGQEAYDKAVTRAIKHRRADACEIRKQLEAGLITIWEATARLEALAV